MKHGKLDCAEIQELLVFYACDEVTDSERATIEQHLETCSVCRMQLAEEQEFRSLLASLPVSGEQLDPAGTLLSRCRSELAETLDDLAHPAAKQKVSLIGWLRNSLIVHPASSAFALLLLGLVLGVASTHWWPSRKDGVALSEAVNVRPGPRLTEEQLSKMAVAGINFLPSSDAGSQHVRVQLSAEQPMEFTGSLDDSDVRSVLTYVVKNGERFDSGMRLDCLDALKHRSGDAQVRAALLAAARNDQNPAVRLKALEALHDVHFDREVRDVLLEALKHDANPGVRVEAVNLLVRSLERPNRDSAIPADVLQAGGEGILPDPSREGTIEELRALQRSDPSPYVRLRSAAALREISLRNEQ